MTARQMVDSGVEWIGEVPEGWKTSYMADAADIHLGKMLTPNAVDGTTEVSYFRAANITGTDSVLKTMHATSCDVQKNMVSPGDVLICEGGSIGYPKQLSKEDIPQPYAIIQNSVHRLRFRGEQRYGYWVTRSAYDSGAYLAAINAVSIAHLTKEKLQKFLVPLPPLSEQQSIAAYLDHHVGLIDREKDLIKRKIELLKEKRKAVIFEAVTGRVDVGFGAITTENNGGTRKSVESGIEWIGEVPEGWEVRRGKDCLVSTSGSNQIKGYLHEEPGVGLFPAYSASGQDVWSERSDFETPGIVISAVGARCGKCFKADGQWATAANTHVLFTKNNTIRDYIWYLINNENWWNKGGTAQPFVQVLVSLSKVLSLPPPSEQHAIAAYLDHHVSIIDHEQDILKRKIELIKDKRKALIFEAVTGKIDVTTAA